MSRTAPGVEMTTWFEAETDTPDPSTFTKYTLTTSYSIDSAQSPKNDIVEAVLDVADLPDGQTTLTLYEFVDPDALDDLVNASVSKQSAVEVRFTVEEYLVVVRSTGTILIYEPLRA